MSELVPNIGALDRVLRFVAAICIFVATFGSLHFFDTDWTLTLLLHPAIFAAYLLLTAVARIDPFYHGAGWSTWRTRPPREERRLRTPRSPGRPRRSL